MPRKKASRRRAPSRKGVKKPLRLSSYLELEQAVKKGRVGIFEIPANRKDAQAEAARITGQLTGACEQIQYLGVAHGCIRLEVRPFPR